MFLDVLRARERRQVRESVVRRIVVDVMHDYARCQWTVSRFPHDHSAELPDVGLGHLHEPPNVAPAWSPAKALRPDGKMVAGSDAHPELGARRATHASRCWLEIAGADRGALVGAVVGCTPLGGFAVEGRSANGAQKIRAASPRQPYALARAEGAPRSTGRLTAQQASHAVQSSGSGTTLAAAVGLGRDAIGFDLDARNADLCRDRVGMFLTVVDR